ncbi:unnamed protein product [Caenorhabditis auriculariae]|uniref:RRM domain-containing protein n=1 Tax=Caenorhabditis auriculariae TaxID=2777116 RepID=A0A8S1GQM8_9PELO|nr:unnamed protein product [Caenorhabditis auriculariae]
MNGERLEVQLKQPKLDADRPKFTPFLMISPDVQEFLLHNQNAILSFFKSIDDQKSSEECSSTSCPNSDTKSTVTLGERRSREDSRERKNEQRSESSSPQRDLLKCERRFYQLSRPINSSATHKRRSAIRRTERITPSRCVGVFGMSQYTDERDLYAIFREFGRIEKVNVIRDHSNQRSRGFGFVYMRATSEAQRAIEALANAIIDGHRVRVDFASSTHSRR